MISKANTQKYLFVFIFFGLLTGFSGFVPGRAYAVAFIQQVPAQDTTSTEMAQDTAGVVQDTTRGPYRPGVRPTFTPDDRFGDPFSSRPSASPLYPAPATNMEVEIDTGFNYTLYEDLGDIRYRPVTSMSLEEYNRYMRQRTIREYWKNKSSGLDGESAVSGRSLIPPIYTSPVFDRIFGGSFVNIRPNGFVNLDFGARFDRVDNPTIPIRAQRRNQFHFDQQIAMNVVGEIGDKLKVIANFDSNNSFDFENNFRVEYTGYEEDIIKKIEIGNVNLPVRNSLMSGSQSLFGVKTQLQFGRLFVTGVATTQRGESDAITIEGGSQSSTFSMPASQYDDNRHFFLGHFFREHYGILPGQWLANLPQINSGINVTRLEVYVVNRSNDTQTLRNVAAFGDLGEGDPENLRLPKNDFVGTPDATQNDPSRNAANDIFSNIIKDSRLRSLDRIDSTLSQEYNLVNSTDYVILKSARKLDPKEYTFNTALGYLSLNRKLQNDEALAVSFEYTYRGQRYQVGELSENYQNRAASEIIFMKMLRPNKISTAIPAWKLMMKNIYNLNANQVSREGFQLRIFYRDDRSSIDNPNLQEGVNTKNIPLVQVLGLDSLNQANDQQPDGNFDFIEGVTINLEKGNIIFPVEEPFGDHLRRQFLPGEQALVNRYVYDTLYRTTQNDAQQVVSKNKFFIEGSYSASSTSEIALPGINIAEGSVRVYAGNNPLTEGVDYQVDYNFGRVRILNEGITNSGKKIRIEYEKASLMNFQTRRFLGTQFDYIFNEDFSIGGTLLYLNELPMITRVNIGDEPTKNTKWGLDINYRKDSRFLTRMVDLLPFVQTKELSTITLNGEFAQLIPGTSNEVTGEGTSYIDDFEAAITEYNLGTSSFVWNLAATPQTDDNRFLGKSTGLEFGYKRAKLAWYVVDNIFYNSGSLSRYAPNLDKEAMLNHYYRLIDISEISSRDRQSFNPPVPVFNLAYFPEERGSYNYNPDLTDKGKLTNPKQNWGGITRAITSDVDFDRNNIEYIEFWMMDPFITGTYGRDAAFQDYDLNGREGSGGKLIFNLGNVSEDYIKDSRHGFENGLPADFESKNQVEETPWGRVSTKQYLNNAFEVNVEASKNQDVGMDGLPNEAEAANFMSGFLDKLVPSARSIVEKDPSADNYQPFVSEELNEANANIITRYKNYNNQEGNTPLLQNNNDFTPPSNKDPDNEDLNGDNTINDLEDYFEYQLDLTPAKMEVGQNYIVDKRKGSAEGQKDQATWYLFRIPIRDYDRSNKNVPEDFKSVRFIRTYLTGFEDPVVLRMAEMQLVGSQWRKSREDLKEDGLKTVQEEDPTDFTVSAVSYEMNSDANGVSIPYVVPPGFIRDRDNTAYNQTVRLNEQSIQLCADNLENRDARAVFKNVQLDLINYGTIKMLLHAQAGGNQFLQDGEVSAFLRLGYDYTDNYYEVEIPLQVTPPGTTDPQEIWPAQNEIDIALDALYELKAARNRLGKSPDIRFAGESGTHKIYVKGNPETNNILTLMIGVRNPDNGTDKSSKSVCVWANELRVTDFDRTAGWAGNARMNTKLADLATVSASTRYTSVGFGNIGDRISQRTRDENFSYDVSANIALDKFLPERARLQLPMFISYEQNVRTPFYDPANPDLPLSAAINTFETPEEQLNYKTITQDRATRRSINFTNIRLAPKKENPKTGLFRPENLSLTYAYSDVVSTSWEMAEYILTTQKAAIGYNFAPEPKPIVPFGSWEKLNSPYLQLLRDFNFSLRPSTISIRWDLDRRFQMRQLRNSDLTTNGILPQFEKLFTMNRQYNLRWNITSALMLDYNARANAIIDEPDGAIDSDIKREEVLDNLSHLGRMKFFDQNIGLTYRLPFDKFPLTNWVSAESRYETSYNWTSASFEQRETFGNIIQNSRNLQLSGKLDLVKLYNKATWLKKVNDLSQKSGRPTPPPRPGQQQPAGQTDNEPQKVGAAGGVARFLMSVRAINFNYTRTQGTMLPGFLPRAFLFGFDSSFVAPGLPFILGSQDPSIRNIAVDNNWLVDSESLTNPFTQSVTENIDIRADLEPFRDFRITLDLKKNKTAGFQELFRIENGDYTSLTPARNGAYSISFLALGSTFDKELENNGSRNFERFKENRQIIQQRLEEIESRIGGEFTDRSQDVLIPAFIATYSGKDPEEVKLSPFPNIPLPNWRVDYAGLSKIPSLKEKFSAITLSHSYVSRYSVNNFNSNSLYFESSANITGTNPDINLSRKVESYSSEENTMIDVAGETNNLLPLYQVDQVVISEQFSPLIGLNLRTKSRVTGQINYNKERNLALNMSNTQMTEASSNDIRLDLGYTTKNFKLPFRSRGREIILKNDITFRMGFTLRRNKMVQRKFDEQAEITNGSTSIQLNPTINYLINQTLSVQLYYNTNINKPLVLISSPSTQTNVGIQIRYNITQ